MHTYIHTYIHTCMCIQTHIHTYIHTHIHKYFHTFIHTHCATLSQQSSERKLNIHLPWKEKYLVECMKTHLTHSIRKMCKDRKTRSCYLVCTLMSYYFAPDVHTYVHFLYLLPFRKYTSSSQHQHLSLRMNRLKHICLHDILCFNHSFVFHEVIKKCF